MSYWHGYMAVEDVNLNATQRQELWDELQNHIAFTVQQVQPAEYPQYRFNTDTTKVIIEAKFRESWLTIEKFKQRLGTIFEVDPSTIDHSTAQQTFVSRSTPIVTFSRLGVNYVRFAAFAGVKSTYRQSLIEVRQYLADNIAEWELG